MQVNENALKFQKDINLAAEKKESKVVAAKYLEDKEQLKQKMNEQKAHFAEIWNAQKTLKLQNDGADNAF